MNSIQLSRVTALRDKLTQLGIRIDDDDSSSIVGTGLKAVGAGATIYGGVKAGGAVMDKMEAMRSGPGSKAFKKMGTLGQVGKASRGVAGDVWGYLKKQGSRLITAGSLERLTTLSAKLPATELGLGYGEQVGEMMKYGAQKRMLAQPGGFISKLKWKAPASGSGPWKSVRRTVPTSSLNIPQPAMDQGVMEGLTHPNAVMLPGGGVGVPAKKFAPRRAAQGFRPA